MQQYNGSIRIKTTYKKTHTQARKYTRPNLHRKYRNNRSTTCIHRQLHIRPQNSWNRTTAKKKHEKSESSRHRNIKVFNLKTFTKECNNDRILQQTPLEKAHNKFTQGLTRTLDKITPMKDKKKPERRIRPQYSNELLQQRKITRNSERVYNIYQEEHQWKAFTIERNRCNRMLDFNKRNYIVKQVTGATNDSKNYFR